LLLLLLLLTTTNKNTIKKINCYHFCLRAALRALTAKFSAGSYIHKVQSPHLQNKKRWGVHRQKVHRHKIQNHGAEQGSSKSTSQNKLTHTDTHRHTQTHTCTYVHIRTHTHAHTHTQTHTHTHTHTYVSQVHCAWRTRVVGARRWRAGETLSLSPSHSCCEKTTACSKKSRACILFRGFRVYGLGGLRVTLNSQVGAYLRWSRV